MKRTVGKWGGTWAVRLTRELKDIGIADVNGAEVDVYTKDDVILIAKDKTYKETISRINKDNKVTFCTRDSV